MKYTLYRRLLIFLDLLLAAGIAGAALEAVRTRQDSGAWELKEKDRLQARVKAESARRVARPVVNRDYLPLGQKGGPLLAGIEPKKPEPVEATTRPEQPVEHTPLGQLVQVRAIVSGSPEDAYVYLDKRNGNLDDAENRYFHELQQVDFVGPETVVKEIKRESVVFLYHGEEVELPLEPPKKEGGAAPTPAAGSGPAVAPNPDPRTWVQARPSSSIVDVTPVGVRSMREYGADEVLKGVVWKTDRLPDGKRAIRFQTVPSESVLARGGLKGGDTLVSINGTRVTSRSDVVSYVRANPDLPRYTVALIRNGQRIERTVMPKR